MYCIINNDYFFFFFQDECQNYIRVLAKEGEGQFLVCGTNAYKPRCRHYAQQVSDSLESLIDEMPKYKSCRTFLMKRKREVISRTQMKIEPFSEVSTTIASTHRKIDR